MAEKFEEPRERRLREMRAESENRAAKLLAAHIVAIAAYALLFDDDSDRSD